ncbi:MAG: hypothetical protein Q8P88_01065 [Candidatus Jorgensenbacteria bacterium]|nr:hypothetical protein [Candidatus Jorgensenbacteria bacterium]
MLSLRIWKITESSLPLSKYYLRRNGDAEYSDEKFPRFLDLKGHFEKLLTESGSDVDVVLVCAPPAGTPDMAWQRSRGEPVKPERPSSLDESERNELWNALCNFALKESAYASHPT